ncbi:MAG: zinc ribbon domain-containing protein [Armatimonadota bacterium]
MAVTICPKCGAVVQATDTHCMDCGVNIAEAERELARRAKQERGGGPLVGEVQTVHQGAAAGMAIPGETSEKVRLKEFDRHLADKLVRERSAVIVTALIALVAGTAVFLLGLGALGRLGGMEALRALSYGELRAQGLGAFANQTFLSVLAILLGLAGLMCAAGQIQRVVVAHRAVNLVRRNERPPVVGISLATWYGLLIAAFVCPPLGIILGIVFKMGQDEETRTLGGSMIKSALIAVAVVAAHLIWNAVAGFATQAGATVNAARTGG